jgi:hypothetical protein
MVAAAKSTHAGNGFSALCATATAVSAFGALSMVGGICTARVLTADPSVTADTAAAANPDRLGLALWYVRLDR